MTFIKLNPRTLLLFITTTAISLGVVCGDVGKLRGQLSKGMKYVAKVNEQKILITTPKDEPSQIDANDDKDEEAPIVTTPADRTGMSPDDIRARIRKSFDDVLNQKKRNEVLNSMTDMDKHMQQLYDNFDTVLNHQGRTDWGYTGMSNEDIDQLRTRIFQSRVELQAKLQQGIVIEDSSLKLDLDAVKVKFDQEAHDAMDALEDYEDEDENAAYLFSSTDEERQHNEGEDCAYKFRNEESLDFFHKSKKGEERICESSVTIVSKSDIDQRALIADGQCNFDPTHGYWYVAECRPPSTTTTTSELPEFVMTKAFCHVGCNLCSDPHKLPNILGIPTGPVYRTWNGPSRGVCELPPVTPNLEGNIDSLWVQHEGNCIQETCVNKHK